MGKGLDLKPSGVHIAFTGGTGVLVFLDLVAYLIRESLCLHDTDGRINRDFKFVLFTSYASEKDVLGKGLCRGLEEVCKRLGNHYFEYHERISNRAPDHHLHSHALLRRAWNEEFIEEKLNHYKEKGDIKKIWVCGPPVMNETFDKALLNLAPKFNLDPVCDIEIL